MNRAIALVHIGRTDEASALITQAIGPADNRRVMDQLGIPLWDLPGDRGNGPEDLIATAQVLRAITNASGEDALPDLQAALKISPRNPSTELVFGRLLFLKGDFGSAIPHYEIALKKGSKKTIAQAEKWLVQARTAATRPKVKGAVGGR